MLLIMIIKLGIFETSMVKHGLSMPGEGGGHSG